MAPEPQHFAYGQSWAFTHFLMNNYRDEFLEFQERMAREKPKENEDVEWLAEALGKDLREVEKEFLAYMDGFEEAEYPDFDVKLYDLIYETFY